MLVKPKHVWEAGVWLKNYKQTTEKCKQSFENGRKLLSIKHILALSK